MVRLRFSELNNFCLLYLFLVLIRDWIMVLLVSIGVGVVMILVKIMIRIRYWKIYVLNLIWKLLRGFGFGVILLFFLYGLIILELFFFIIWYDVELVMIWFFILFLWKVLFLVLLCEFLNDSLLFGVFLSFLLGDEFVIVLFCCLDIIFFEFICFEFVLWLFNCESNVWEIFFFFVDLLLFNKSLFCFFFLFKFW